MIKDTGWYNEQADKLKDTSAEMKASVPFHIRIMINGSQKNAIINHNSIRSLMDENGKYIQVPYGKEYYLHSTVSSKCKTAPIYKCIPETNEETWQNFYNHDQG